MARIIVGQRDGRAASPPAKYPKNGKREVDAGDKPTTQASGTTQYLTDKTTQVNIVSYATNFSIKPTKEQEKMKIHLH
ncbi:hypothetical protein Mapa_011476 [Marchantia paleacea]|nr:hypothetical protein Mapa_011476 [Marchantia paleacea]